MDIVESLKEILNTNYKIIKDKKTTGAIKSAAYKLIEVVVTNFNAKCLEIKDIWTEYIKMVKETLTNKNYPNELKVIALSSVRKCLKY